MFYRTSEGSGLKHDPLNALIIPRPIGWISSQDAAGNANLAPYSFFNAVAYHPPQVMFSATGPHAMGGLKDTVRNIQETGEFVVNLATWALREKVVASAVDAPPEIDEFRYAGLTPVASELVRPPRVKESPVHLECKLTRTVNLESDDPDIGNIVTFGRVIGIHIADWAIKDGKVDVVKLEPIARLGYTGYCRVTETFDIDRPRWSVVGDE